MNKYKCLYNNEEIIVEATTSYNAQTAGFNVFSEKYPRRKIKAYQVTPYLYEKDGVEVDFISQLL
jgi:hypothetical protein